MKKRNVVFIVIFCILVILITIGIYIKIQKNTEWIITQYGDNEGAQMMCFTIKGNKKRISNN